MPIPFRGGVAFGHAAEHKEQTAQSPIRPFTPAQLVLLMRQGFGAVCEPTVKAGDRVLAGQVVGRPPASQDNRPVFAAPVHCGVSGTVRAVEPRPSAEGETLAVVVDSDGKGEAAPPLLSANSRDGIRALMKEAGLTGMGGAGFPTFFKYDTNKPIRYVLVNGAECEPYLTGDHRLMAEQPEQVVAGAKALGLAAGDAEVFLCVEGNKPDAIARLEDASGPEENVSVVRLPAKYPQGGERQLIKTVLGREVPAGGLPADCGALVTNVGTAVAMADALRGRPLTHRVVTVSGRVAKPANLYVPIGTRLSDLLEYCGGAVGEDRLLWVAGGPMTGAALATTEVPVTKGTTGLVVLDRPENRESNCIRCGGCARVCPSSLLPFAIDAAVISGDMAACTVYRADQCISCGCCSYICPAKRHLAHRVTMARSAFREKRVPRL